MRYRRFGRLDWQVSALGFGAMRLPLIDDDPGGIDEDEAIRMIHHAIEGGVNYVDTAYPYHRGAGEKVVGRALAGGYRQRVRLATKMPVWLAESAADFDRFFDEQLARLDTDHIDFYLLHALGAERWQKAHALGILDWAERQMASGRIGHLGFSFHDTCQVFEEIVDAYDSWTMCQIHYNFLEEEHQAGTRGLRYAAARGLAVSIMGPIGGGLLSANPPATVQALWDAAARKRTPADWALQWVWNQPEVSVALSGMSTMAQLEENLASAEVSGVGTLTPKELGLIEQVRDTYLALRPIPCTGCKYCQPCPNDVLIPDLFDLYNTAFIHSARAHSLSWYQKHQSEGHAADQCLECGQCESQCPQKIAIIEWLPKVHAYFQG